MQIGDRDANSFIAGRRRTLSDRVWGGLQKRYGVGEHGHSSDPG